MRKERKKEHKRIVKHMREINKSRINNEYIGIGRFRIDLIQEEWNKYEDGSGGYLFLIFQITDTFTKNKCWFSTDNYNYARRMFYFANDFLIRCSSGRMGHYPPLNYIAYDVHDFCPYSGSSNRISQDKESVVDKYNLIRQDW